MLDRLLSNARKTGDEVASDWHSADDVENWAETDTGGEITDAELDSLRDSSCYLITPECPFRFMKRAYSGNELQQRYKMLAASQNDSVALAETEKQLREHYKKWLVRKH